MADNRIRFVLESLFKGEGFQKASKAVKDTSGVVKNAADGVKNLSAEMSGMGGVIGKVSDGVGKLFGVFMAGGPVGIAVAAISLLVGAFVKWRGEIEKAREEHEKFLKSAQDGYQNRLMIYAQKSRKAAIDAMNASIDAGTAAIEKVQKLSAAYDRLAQSELAAAKSASALKVAEIDQGLAVGATYRSKDDQKRAELNAKIEKEMIAYADALRDAKEKQRSATRKVEDLDVVVANLEVELEEMDKAGADTTKKQQELANALNDRRIAEKNLEAAENAVSLAETKHETALTNLTKEQTDLEFAISRRTEEEQRAREAAERKVQAEHDAQDKIDALTDKTQTEIDVLDRQIAAQNGYIQHLDELAARDDAAMGAIGRTGQGDRLNYGANGRPTKGTSDYLGRMADRADRDMGGTNDLIDQAQREMLDLENEAAAHPTAWSDQKQKKLDRLRDYLGRQQDVAKEQKKLKEMEAEKDRLQKQLYADVSEIRKNLKEALEVK